jgi:hypothetical protein
VKRATLSIALEDAAEDAVASFYELARRLDGNFWAVQTFVDDQSLVGGGAERLYLQAQRSLATLSELREALVESGVLSGWLAWDGEEWDVVGGVLMRSPEAPR